MVEKVPSYVIGNNVDDAILLYIYVCMYVCIIICISLYAYTCINVYQYIDIQKYMVILLEAYCYGSAHLTMVMVETLGHWASIEPISERGDC